MPIKMRCLKPPAMAMIAMFLLIAYIAGPVYADETPAGPGGEKCSPCSQSPPPPPPSPPPPSPKKPPSSPYCPPPPSTPSTPSTPTTPSTPSSPSTPLLYITGPPGDLYPVDHSINGASPSLVTGLPFLLGRGLLGLLLAFW